MPETRYRTCDLCDELTEHVALRGLVDIAAGSTDWECRDCGHVKEVSW